MLLSWTIDKNGQATGDKKHFNSFRNIRFSLPSHITKKEKGVLKVKIIVLSGLFKTLVQYEIHIMHESFTDYIQHVMASFLSIMVVARWCQLADGVI